MVKCTQFGTAAGRQIVLIEADSTEAFEPWPVLPSSHFVCLVVWDAPSKSEVVRRVAQALVEAGAVYVCAFGDGCERVELAVDEVIVTGEREPDVNHVILTTSHATETLDDALWFALFTAFPAATYDATCSATVVVAINADRYSAPLRRDLGDPEAFNARTLAE